MAQDFKILKIKEFDMTQVQNIAEKQKTFVVKLDKKIEKIMDKQTRQKLVGAYLKLFTGLSWINWTKKYPLGRAWHYALAQCKKIIKSKNKKNPAVKYLDNTASAHSKYWSQVIMTNENSTNILNKTPEEIKHIRQYGIKLVRDAMDEINLTISQYNEFVEEKEQDDPQAQVAAQKEQAQAVPQKQQAQVAVQKEQAQTVPQKQQAQVAVQKEQAQTVPQKQQAQVAVQKEQAQTVPQKQQAQVAAQKEQSQVAPQKQQAQVAAQKEQAQAVPQKQQAQVAAQKEQAQTVPQKQQAQVAAQKEQAQTVPQKQQAQVAAQKEQAQAVPQKTIIHPVKFYTIIHVSYYINIRNHIYTYKNVSTKEAIKNFTHAKNKVTELTRAQQEKTLPTTTQPKSLPVANQQKNLSHAQHAKNIVNMWTFRNAKQDMTR